MTGLFAVLPRSFVVTLAGVAILSALQGAFEAAFGGKLRFGALMALVVAATPSSARGITSAFWALLAAIVAAVMAERHHLLAYWRSPKERGPWMAPDNEFHWIALQGAYAGRFAAA